MFQWHQPAPVSHSATTTAHERCICRITSQNETMALGPLLSCSVLFQPRRASTDPSLCRRHVRPLAFAPGEWIRASGVDLHPWFVRGLLHSTLIGLCKGLGVQARCCVSRLYHQRTQTTLSPPNGHNMAQWLIAELSCWRIRQQPGEKGPKDPMPPYTGRKNSGSNIWKVDWSLGWQPFKQEDWGTGASRSTAPLGNEKTTSACSQFDCNGDSSMGQSFGRYVQQWPSIKDDRTNGCNWPSLKSWWHM